MMTDPIADMLTRIRNASAVEKPATEMPATKMKIAIANVLKEEGFILDFQVDKYTEKDGAPEFHLDDSFKEPKTTLRVYLKYGPDGEKVIRNIDRASKPGQRYYRGAKEIKRVLDGLGISIISTSAGVMSDRQARAKGVGGEVICQVW
jgi:small subunit ribosomal protein S8